MRSRELIAALLTVAACGGGSERPDVPADGPIAVDAAMIDGPPVVIDGPDEPPPPPPPPPTLGPQLHRAGRAATKALLLGTFTSGDPVALAKAYDEAADPAAWRTLVLPNGSTIERDFAGNLAVWDGLDRGRSGINGPGCGNTLKYSGPAGPASYLFMAGLFADDQLYVDTAKATCGIYFDLELARAQPALFATTCGGRTPSHDAIDMTYSVLAAGFNGIDTSRVPRLTDAVGAHADVTTAFPFLGPPR